MADSLATVGIDEILEYEEKVYVDPSAGGHGHRISLGSHLHCTSRMENLNPDLITGTHDEMNFLGTLLVCDKAATINAATTELRRFDRIVRKYVTVRNMAMSFRGQKNRSLLENLIQKIKINIDLSEDKEVKTDSSQYKVLKEMVKFIADEFELKEDKRKKYGEARGKLKPLDTDEGYVTACLLDALAGKKSALLTADTDYINLLGVTPRILGSPDFYPYNQFFRNAITNYFPHLFFIDNYGTINLKDFDSVIDFIKSSESSRMPEKMKKSLQKKWEEKYYIITGNGKNHHDPINPQPQSTTPQ